jgi:hypothetical protein
MIDEPTAATYSDEDLTEYVEAYPTLDVLGTDPLEVDYNTEPPTISERSGWIPTYDLHAAAADIWLEKSAAVAEDYNFSADGSTLNRGEVQKQYMAHASRHRAMRKPGTVKLRVEPRLSPDPTDGVINDD